MTRLSLIPGIAALFLAVPAHAQEAPPLAPENSVFSGDFLIIGAGPVVVPSYEGADELHVIPAAGVAGRIGGISINPRAAGIALDLIPDSDAKVGLTLGPVLRYRTNRSGKVADPAVAALGKLKGVVEAGVNAGLAFKGVLNSHDSLSVSVDLRWDISGQHSGLIVSPGVSYLTPLSRAQVIGMAAGVNFIDERYARYNFGVTPAGSAASGLPVYAAHGGLKDWNFGAFTARDLNGNFLDGGFALAVGAMYSHLYGSAAESPVTRLRGKRGQWIFGGGLAYVF
jgi:outer membrane scaffolding protein for murein synthesis (MipA/OmpV family)